MHSKSLLNKIVSGNFRRSFPKAKRIGLLLCTLCFVPLLVWCQDAPSKKLLVFSKTKGFRHESIEVGVEALKKLGAENGIEVEATEKSSWFNTKKLKEYDAVLFLSTSGNVFNQKQEAAFKNFIQSGGGFMGIHGASTTEYEWDWYGKMIGGYFDGHPEPQEATLIVHDNTHLSTQHLSQTWKRFDEWYNFRWMDDNFNLLISVDESTYKGGKHKNGHPISWYKPFEGGRMFYTALGHTKESYSDERFLNHVLGGILYVLDKSASE